MNQTNIKLGIGAVLFATWVALVVFNVPNTEDIIAVIKTALAALGAHTLTVIVPESAKQPQGETK